MFLLGCPLTEFVFLEEVQAIFGQCRGENRSHMILNYKYGLWGCMKRFNTYFEIMFGKISKFIGKRWDLFLENGTKWEVEGGLGEYGCKRRPDESVQIIGSSYIYNMENIFLFQFGNIFSPIGKSFCLIWKYIFSKFRSEYLSKLNNKHGWMQMESWILLSGQCGPLEEGTEIQIDFDITESMVRNIMKMNSWNVKNQKNETPQRHLFDQNHFHSPCYYYKEGEAVTIRVCHDLTRSSSIWARHTLWDEVGHQRSL